MMFDFVDGSEIHKHERLLLRPWLENLIDSGNVLGLEWIDGMRTAFRVPWKHQSRKTWSVGQSSVFLEWAKNTGRWKEGDPEPHYAQLKTRLRCAFSKAPDIEEVKSLHCSKTDEPYKVYRFISKKDNRLYPFGRKSITRKSIQNSIKRKCVPLRNCLMPGFHRDHNSRSPRHQILLSSCDKEHPVNCITLDSKLNNYSLQVCIPETQRYHNEFPTPQRFPDEFSTEETFPDEFRTHRFPGEFSAKQKGHDRFPTEERFANEFSAKQRFPDEFQTQFSTSQTLPPDEIPTRPNFSDEFSTQQKRFDEFPTEQRFSGGFPTAQKLSDEFPNQQRLRNEFPTPFENVVAPGLPLCIKENSPVILPAAYPPSSPVHILDPLSISDRLQTNCGRRREPYEFYTYYNGNCETILPPVNGKGSVFKTNKSQNEDDEQNSLSVGLSLSNNDLSVNNKPIELSRDDTSAWLDLCGLPKMSLAEKIEMWNLSCLAQTTSTTLSVNEVVCNGMLLSKLPENEPLSDISENKSPKVSSSPVNDVFVFTEPDNCERYSDKNTHPNGVVDKSSFLQILRSSEKLGNHESNVAVAARIFPLKNRYNISRNCANPENILPTLRTDNTRELQHDCSNNDQPFGNANDGSRRPYHVRAINMSVAPFEKRDECERLSGCVEKWCQFLPTSNDKPRFLHDAAVKLQDFNNEQLLHHDDTRPNDDQSSGCWKPFAESCDGNWPGNGEATDGNKEMYNSNWQSFVVLHDGIGQLAPPSAVREKDHLSLLSTKGNPCEEIWTFEENQLMDVTSSTDEPLDLSSKIDLLGCESNGHSPRFHLHSSASITRTEDGGNHQAKKLALDDNVLSSGDVSSSSLKTIYKKLLWKTMILMEKERELDGLEKKLHARQEVLDRNEQHVQRSLERLNEMFNASSDNGNALKSLCQTQCTNATQLIEFSPRNECRDREMSDPVMWNVNGSTKQKILETARSKFSNSFDGGHERGPEVEFGLYSKHERCAAGGGSSALPQLLTSSPRVISNRLIGGINRTNDVMMMAKGNSSKELVDCISSEAVLPPIFEYSDNNEKVYRDRRCQDDVTILNVGQSPSSKAKTTGNDIILDRSFGGISWNVPTVINRSLIMRSEMAPRELGRSWNHCEEAKNQNKSDEIFFRGIPEKSFNAGRAPRKYSVVEPFISSEFSERSYESYEPMMSSTEGRYVRAASEHPDFIVVGSSLLKNQQ